MAKKLLSVYSNEDIIFYVKVKIFSKILKKEKKRKKAILRCVPMDGGTCV